MQTDATLAGPDEGSAQANANQASVGVMDVEAEPQAGQVLDPTGRVGMNGAHAGVLPAEAPSRAPVAPPEVGAPPAPFPFPLPLQTLQGRYRSTTPGWQVELRCDPDGRRPTNRVSADYYSVSGATVSYFGSMRLDAASISVTPSLVTISGLGTYTFGAAAPRVTVTIPRQNILTPHVAATLRHSTLAGAPGATYLCRFESAFARTVLLEQDRQDTVPTIFSSYNTGSLPSGGPGRTLSIASAYAEHGIQMLDTGATDVVNTSAAGANGTWSDAELHAAMQNHFSRWVDLPQWAVWLFHAQQHDLGTGLLGIMFDQSGRQRQGCAVFYAGLAGATATQQRLQLYTTVHELGHCFNLLHSWQKSFATPPIPNRPGSPSFMNYPWRFPGGEAAFWSAFGFQFDDPELIHLRHAFRDNIIMGGSNFGVGSALDAPEGWRSPEVDESGLKLELRAPQSFTFGAPVSIDLSLSATDTRGKRVIPYLKPEFGIVDIAIKKPGGRTLAYRPLLQRCVGGQEASLTSGSPTISDSAFIGYGQDGFYFDEPGFYDIRARYSARDGSIVLSNVLKVRVKSPVTAADDNAADLVFGDEQGTLFYLMGSDYEGLKNGNAALTQLREQYAKHPLAAYASLVQGVNEAREFKEVKPDNSVSVRAPRPTEAEALLRPHLDTAAIRSAAAAGPPDASAAVMAGQLAHVAVTRNLAPDLISFIRARSMEIATEIRGLP